MNLKLVKILTSMNSNGFALMEVIVALFMITTGIIGSYILISSSISSTTYASHRFTAAYLAQEGVELVRNIRDTNWLQGTPTTWDAGLTDCVGSCTGAVSEGCIADYTVSGIADVDLHVDTFNTGIYTGQALTLDPSGTLYSYISLVPTKFQRQINIVPSGLDKLDVCVWVGWEERGVSHNITVRENLYDWH